MTTTTTNVAQTVLNIMTKQQFENITPSATEFYAITDVEALPSQTGNAGKFLTTNGTNASWATVVSSTITYWE